jgi:hypothetical protein
MKCGRKILLLMVVVVFSIWIVCQGTSNRLRLALAGVPLKASYTLKHADQFILYSLDPRRDLPLERVKTSAHLGEEFHSYRVLGKIEIAGANEREKLLNDLFASIPTLPVLSRYMCFNPRHGIRVLLNGRIEEFLICFECHEMLIFDSANGPKYTSIEFGRVRPPEFNRVLTIAGIKLPQN